MTGKNDVAKTIYNEKVKDGKEIWIHVDQETGHIFINDIILVYGNRICWTGEQITWTGQRH
jgi:hypothetical protein